MAGAATLPAEKAFQAGYELISAGEPDSPAPLPFFERWDLAETEPISRFEVIVHEDPFQVPLSTDLPEDQDLEPRAEEQSLTLKLADPKAESTDLAAQMGPWIEQTIDRFGELAALRPGWDGHGGQTLDIAHVIQAVAFLTVVMRPQTSAPSIVPTSDGGVQLEWHRAGLDVEILFSPEEDEDLYIHERASGKEWEGSAIAGFSEFDLGRRLVG